MANLYNIMYYLWVIFFWIESQTHSIFPFYFLRDCNSIGKGELYKKPQPFLLLLADIYFYSIQ